MKKIIAYKQGNAWIVNINGYLKTLHYSVRTKKDVRAWLKAEQGNFCYEGYEIEFA